jgi:hypothetical protein
MIRGQMPAGDEPSPLLPVLLNSSSADTIVSMMVTPFVILFSTEKLFNDFLQQFQTAMNGTCE